MFNRTDEILMRVINTLMILALAIVATFCILIFLPTDDHGGRPHCTDAIADAGGICWGEP